MQVNVRDNNVDQALRALISRNRPWRRLVRKRKQSAAPASWLVKKLNAKACS